MDPYLKENLTAKTVGYGADWPVDWREMGNYYGQVEQALTISGARQLSLRPEAAAPPLPTARVECGGAGVGARLREFGIDGAPIPLATASAAQEPAPREGPLENPD